MLRRYVDFYSKLKFFKVCDFKINELIWKENISTNTCKIKDTN